MAARDITLNLRPDRFNGAFIQSYKNGSALLLSSFYREEKVSLRVYFVVPAATGGLSSPLTLQDLSAYDCRVGIGVTDGDTVLCVETLTWDTDHFEGVLNVNTTQMNAALDAANGADIQRTFEVELKKSDEEFTFQQTVTIKNEVLTDGASLPEDVTDELFADMLRATISGRETIWIPASAMTARDTNGATPYSVETPSHKLMLQTLAFDKDVIQYAQFQVAMPKSWNRGTVVARILTTSDAVVSSGNVIFGVQAVAFEISDTMDPAFGTAQEKVVGAWTPLALNIVSTDPITIGGAPLINSPIYDESLVVFQIYRKATDGNDDFDADSLLLGANIYYTTEDFNDD